MATMSPGLRDGAEAEHQRFLRAAGGLHDRRARIAAPSM
jgi:hypothetical protein